MCLTFFGVNEKETIQPTLEHMVIVKNESNNDMFLHTLPMKQNAKRFQQSYGCSPDVSAGRFSLTGCNGAH